MAMQAEMAAEPAYPLPAAPSSFLFGEGTKTKSAKAPNRAKACLFQLLPPPPLQLAC